MDDIKRVVSQSIDEINEAFQDEFGRGPTKIEVLSLIRVELISRYS
ncbi:hypothetical protein FDI69_gp223 [Rhodococcus phage Trina]|uniref:Uncharacterized protein n=1 Tax=Rhodococcus phage Trina TaxID=2027905 RepID=A0A2D0ZWR5_9CAUD|nr:hypothetical protein FDI69_gp223 [Rhodococcus phage Trina]ASZ74963.1 hypothetical protein SEA_TRINA_175 [Rhodococcus phage Trina]